MFTNRKYAIHGRLLGTHYLNELENIHKRKCSQIVNMLSMDVFWDALALRPFAQ